MTDPNSNANLAAYIDFVIASVVSQTKLNMLSVQTTAMIQAQRLKYQQDLLEREHREYMRFMFERSLLHE